MAARQQVTEALAFLASRDRERFADLFRSIGASVDGPDPFSVAEQAAAAVYEKIEAAPETTLGRRFSEHLRFNGQALRTARRRGELVRLSSLALGVETLDRAAAADEAALELWRRWVESRTNESDADAVLSRWSAFRSDLAAADARLEFAYSEFSHSFCGMGVAAAALGGVLDSERPDLVLVGLPFSAFIGSTSRPDPAVEDILEESRPQISKTSHVLFRVQWKVGSRLRMEPSVYKDLISSRFPGRAYQTALCRVRSCLPIDGDELFIGMSDRFVGDFKVISLASVTSAQGTDEESVDGTIDAGSGDDCPVHELAGLFKIPVELLPPSTREACRALTSCVPVPVAERAIKGFLRSIGMC